MARPPLSPGEWALRGAFWLLAIAIGAALFILVAAELGCFWLIVVTRVEPIGACVGISNQAREVWEFILTTVLALLLASRGPPPPPPPE